MTQSPSTPPPEPDPVPAALKRRNQVIAIVAVVLLALVPLGAAFGVDVCVPLEAVGVRLDACAPEVGPELAPAPATRPSPLQPSDGGAQ